MSRAIAERNLSQHIAVAASKFLDGRHILLTDLAAIHHAGRAAHDSATADKFKAMLLAVHAACDAAVLRAYATQRSEAAR